MRPDGPGSTSIPGAAGEGWASQQVAAMAAAWARGGPIAAEAWIAGRPGLDAEAAVRLIYEEVCLRREAGEVVRPAEVMGRFPQWREELEVLFGCDRLLQPRPGAGAVFPEVGETLGTFRLLA